MTREFSRRSTRGAILGLVAVFLVGVVEAELFTSDDYARWNLSHGSLLVDQGRYLEALEAFATAKEMAESTEVEADAILRGANVLAFFLDDAKAAIQECEAVIEKFPDSPSAEVALFQAGMLSFDGQDYAQAERYFAEYLRRYPDGQSRASAEFLLEKSRVPEPEAEPRPPPPEVIKAIRVRVLNGRTSAIIESQAQLETAPSSRRTSALSLSARGDLVFFPGSKEGVRELVIRSTAPIRIRSESRATEYRGHLVVSASEGKLHVINHVNLEDYLYGVVTMESPAGWPAEALKAQAIASRTYSIYQAQRRASRSYDMVDDHGSQVYGGLGGETGAARKAVDATRGIVLTLDDRPILAMFTSNAGWHTANSEDIFGRDLPYLRGREDPFSPEQPMGRWTRSFTTAEVSSSLSGVLRRQLGKIEQIRPTATSPCGRVTRVEVRTVRGSYEMKMRPTLGRALKLPEILLAVHKEGNRFVFSGGGFGHGVGMSQWGAKAMADKGESAAEILAFYYRNTELTALTSDERAHDIGPRSHDAR